MWFVTTPWQWPLPQVEEATRVGIYPIAAPVLAAYKRSRDRRRIFAGRKPNRSIPFEPIRADPWHVRRESRLRPGYPDRPAQLRPPSKWRRASRDAPSRPCDDCSRSFRRWTAERGAEFITEAGHTLRIPLGGTPSGQPEQRQCLLYPAASTRGRSAGWLVVVMFVRRLVQLPRGHVAGRMNLAPPQFSTQSSDDRT